MVPHHDRQLLDPPLGDESMVTPIWCGLGTQETRSMMARQKFAAKELMNSFKLFWLWPMV